MSSRTFRFGDFELDEARAEVRRGGTPLEVFPKPFAVLHYLVLHCDRVVPKQELLDVLWPGIAVSDAALSTAIRQVRRALHDDGASQHFVRTHRGRGFRFVAPVREARVPLVTDAREPSAAGPAPAEDVLVGRLPILRRLRRRLNAAREGRGGVVILSGEAGIGKTALLSRIAATSRTIDVAVHRAWCHAGEGVPPLWPWEQVFGSLGRDLESRIESADARGRFRLFESLSKLLRDVAEEKEGVLLLLDDLHAADSASLQLLEFMLRDLVTSPVLVVCALRDEGVEDLPALTTLLAACARHDGCERIPIPALAHAQVAELLGHLSGGAVAEGWVGRIAESTDGNPFLVRQLFESLQREGRDLRKPAPSELGSGGLTVPTGVRDTLRARLAPLSARERSLLAAASVIGTDFELALLEVVSGHDRAELRSCLARAARLGVVGALGRDRCVFSHGLFRETLYGEIDPRERQALHLRVGRALERDGETPSVARLAAIAHHLERGGVTGGEVPKTIDYLIRAGRHAAERYAFEEADLWYERALELLDREAPESFAQRVDLLHERARARNRLGAGDTRQTFLEAIELARKIGDAPRLARSAAGFTRGREGGTQEPVEQEIALLCEGLTALDGAEPALRAEILHQLGSRWRALGDLERAETHIDEAQAIAVELGEPQLLAEVAQARAYLEWGGFDPGENLRSARRLRELGDQSGAFDPASHGVRLELLAHVSCWDFEAADLAHAELERRTQEHALNGWGSTLIGYRSCRALGRGDLAEATRIAEEQLRLAIGYDDHSALSVHMAQRGEIQYACGDLADLEPAIRSFSPMKATPEVLASLACFWARAERPEEARVPYERAIALAPPARLPRNEFWLATLALLSEAAVALGDRQRAAELRELLLPHARHFVVLGLTTAWTGAVAARLGALAELLGRDDEAASHLDLAIELCDATEARPWAERARLARARLLLESHRGSDRALALSLLASVIAATEEMKMRGLSAEARRLVANS